MSANDWPSPNYQSTCPVCGSIYLGAKRSPSCWKCHAEAVLQMRVENVKLREALEAEEEARQAFQRAKVAEEIFSFVPYTDSAEYRVRLGEWDEAKRQVEPTREKADKLRAEALKSPIPGGPCPFAFSGPRQRASPGHPAAPTAAPAPGEEPE